MNLSHLQKCQPWSIAYSDDFNDSAKEMPHLPASHTILHAAKSVGKLAAVVEELDHTGERHLSHEQRETVKAMSADLVTTAIRLANLCKFDLESVLLNRAAEKNGEAYPPELPAGWTADKIEKVSREETVHGYYRIVARSSWGEVVAYGDTPSEVVSNITAAVYEFLTGNKLS